MAFSIRKAVAQDAPALAEIHLQARRTAMPWLPELHDDGDVLLWMQTHVLHESEVWVAERKGEVIGFAGLSTGFLDHLYVLPGEQGRGAGSALLDRAKERRPDGLRLWVFQRNTQARGFYERRGFELVELTDGSGNEEREPDALYEWRLS